MEVAYNALVNHEHQLKHWLDAEEQLEENKDYLWEEYGTHAWFDAMHQEINDLLRDPEQRVTLEELFADIPAEDYTVADPETLEQYGIETELEQAVFTGICRGEDLTNAFEPGTNAYNQLKQLKKRRTPVNEATQHRLPDYEKDWENLETRKTEALRGIARNLARLFTAADKAADRDVPVQHVQGSDVERIGNYTVLYNPQPTENNTETDAAPMQAVTLEDTANTVVENPASLPFQEQDYYFGDQLKHVIAIYRDTGEQPELAATVLTREGEEGGVYIPTLEETYESATAFIEDEPFRTGSWFQPGANHAIDNEPLVTR